MARWKTLHTSGSSFGSGVTYTGARRLTVGTHPYRFLATYSGGRTCEHSARFA